MLSHKTLNRWIVGVAGTFVAALSISAAQAQAQAAAQNTAARPDALVKEIGDDVLASIKADKEIQAGDLSKISGLVESKILPHVDFPRMTALAVGRNWSKASPEQQKSLQNEFRGLLTRTYAGALSAAKDASIQMRPLRAGADDTDVIVRSQVVQAKGEPIQLDYRMEKSPAGWKIYDVNVLGVWLVETYKASFAQEIDKNGIDGLIKTLADKNKNLERAASKKS